MVTVFQGHTWDFIIFTRSAIVCRLQCISKEVMYNAEAGKG